MLNETVIANLQKAREIITPEDKWCVGVRWWAKDDQGGYAHCALGALEAVQGRHRKNLAASCDPEVIALVATIPADEKAKSSDGWIDFPANAHVAQYNNRSTHKQVLEWFDHTIEHLKQHPMEAA